ncbi:MAG: glycosyltransferase [Lachnospiraceae bacterium]|nr:glycosyltransferase [Candidatus Merdinaster equi]
MRINIGLNGSDVIRTIKYMTRNGIMPAYYAAKERLADRKRQYDYASVPEDELARQRELDKDAQLLVSILVPAYETNPDYMDALLESVLSQTYPCYELIIADASESDVVRDAIEEFKKKLSCSSAKGEDGLNKIVYVHLDENKGISGNTNAGLSFAKGEFVALLDHDDVLTPDALHEMVNAATESGAELIYSDEDKCDETGGNYNTPNFKPDFNADMFLTNNYICHFTMLKSYLIKKLKFREEYDGAQDYDLFLRAYKEVGSDKIAHVAKVLYHWRCHSGSTAANPSSKEYAYEAGRKALESYYKEIGLEVMVKHGKHFGFYDTIYVNKDMFIQRREIGAVGGPLIKKNKIVGGAMNADGTCLYEGLNKNYSGYMNRADLCMDVEALDLRNIRVRDELTGISGEILKEKPELISDIKGLSLEFSKRVRQKGYILMYNPKMRQSGPVC